MLAFVRTPTAHIRKVASVLGGPSQRRLVLVGMASVLLLSGCMLSPLFQAPAAIMTGIAVLLGLAACGGGGGGGGGSSSGGWPAFVSLGLLKTNPTYGLSFHGDDETGVGKTITIGPSVDGSAFNSMAIGAAYTNSNAGTTYVVFGNTKESWSGLADGANALNLENAFEGRGQAIYGFNSSIQSGQAILIAPSIGGGDSIADVVIGAPYANCGDGEAWVVFGSNSGEQRFYLQGGSGPYQMATDATEGWQLRDSGDGSQQLGASLTALDLNGDGSTDLVIGNPVNYGGCSNAHVLVMFGNKTPGSWLYDLAGGEASLKMAGGSSYATGTSLAKGRVNGDGVDDLIIGAPAGSGGVAIVVFGSSTGGIASNLSGLSGDGTQGFGIFNSASSSPRFAQIVASGDVNGDGHDDIIISDRTDGSPYAGRVWVVFGTSSSALGGGNEFNLCGMSTTSGFHIDLPAYTVVDSIAVGNVNGDGFADILIGSTDAQRRGYSTSGFGYNYHTGAVFVIFGSASPVDVATSELNGNNGFTVVGDAYAHIGSAVAIGDLNNDGYPDVAIGATGYESCDGIYGRVWVVWGVAGDSALPAYHLPKDGAIYGNPQ